MLNIKSIPAFRDNYIWLIQNRDQHCVVVDPGDAGVVIDYLTSNHLTLDAILITHHHADHVGGISELVRHYPHIHVVGPANEAIPGITHPVSGGDQIEVFDHIFHIIDLKGHTLGHIGYLGESEVFCGDTLFSAGCGRLFEGTAEEMWQSLQKLRALPEETKVYCAHEYTASNIAFALAVEPENPALQAYRDTVNRLRAHHQPTLPTTIGLEKQINPFLRPEQAEIIKSVSDRNSALDPLSVFTVLREWKNEF
ncbi:hydroxyacylglutathione hydrolase [Vibrio gazogenes]|uniref:Hydroxyacylglutathione hydrolase n=1 Tax=Vibrio gazogenes DSM 21264 = NBRC 103151 TaxID=1123492 RepID=A0A1M4X3U3_VIBGA|nr:hydroxyacylglutathione hydrolase [Vibrio gazogenes]USP13033.1 hydroxyacylglutathione hydrolase [Vibrio gazogenes]SHE88151.1 hydroxyacylglutathione hydrolase [Vibrio gazogenes DSM 21264] [Vibrio gazogenes DSM 21264 = NBRC 103151]SJN58329.1 Hydroxyacylglutathione hydrolase [Vibrio gazogenes]